MSKSFASAHAAALPTGVGFSLSQLPARAFGEELWMQARSVQRRKAAAIAIFIVSIFALAVLDMLVIGLLGVDAAIDVPENPCYGDLASGITSLIGYNVFIAQGIAFTTAKLIDIFAQLIVGQGGRALHAWLVYHVFSDAITRSIETTPASYAFILSAKFEATALGSITTYAKHIFRNSTARQRWLAAWFMMAAAYVLAFPTLVGASAGYFSPLVPYYQLPNGLLLSKEQVVWGDSPSEFTDYMDTEFHCYGVQHAQGSLPANASIVTQGDLGDFFRNSSGDYTPIVELEHCGWGGGPLVCVQANGYIWGMSTWMVVLATGLETIWICGMFGVWWDA